MRYLLSVLLVSVFVIGKAQNRYAFDQAIFTPVHENGDTLLNPWGGGINFPVFNSIDLNFDGQQDLVAFDRRGNRVLPFVATVTNGDTIHRYRPEFASAFALPKYNSGMDYFFLRDFNCDDKKDIFYVINSQIRVYKNISSNSSLEFTPYNNGNLLETYYGSGASPINVAGTDMSAFDDVDGDGDLDILTFGTTQTRLEFHENQSQDHCGLFLVQKTTCWGDFAEGGLRRTVDLDACGLNKKNSPEDVKHAGSSVLSLDLNDDGIKDLLLGNVNFNNISALYNGGTQDSADIVSQDTMFPSPKPVDLSQFPATYYEDATFDGVPDLMVSSINSPSSGSPNVSSNHAGIWRYKNNGTTTNPDFSFVQKDFLQNEMIDAGATSTPRLVDINGDSLTDIIMAIGNRFISPGVKKSQLYFYKNTGTATQPEFTLADTNFADILSYNLGDHIVPAFGDLDDDGDKDMIIGVGSGAGYLFKLENTGSATNPSFGNIQPNYLNNQFGRFASPYLYDINQDGDLDLFVGNAKGHIWYYENTSKTSAQFSRVTNSFGAVDVSDIINDGYAKPAFFRDSGRTTLVVGSGSRGALQYDDVDSIGQAPLPYDVTLAKNTDTSQSFNTTPFGITKRSGRNQFLIRASELKAMGMNYGYISSVGFNITTSSNPRIDNQGFNIKIKNVSYDKLPQFEDNFPQPTALTGKTAAFGNGWNNVQLENNHLWDGESNLLVEVCFRSQNPKNIIHVSMSSTNFKSYAYGDIAGYNNYTANGCEMPFEKSIKKRPDVRFNVIPAITPVANRQNPNLHVGERTSPDFADLNNDGYMDAVVGNMGGGLALFYGHVYDVSNPEPKPIAQKQFEVFPNPTTGKLTIEISAKAHGDFNKVEIYSLAGQKLMRKPISQKRQTLQLGDLSKGVYVVVAKGKNTTETQKVILQ